MSWQFYTATISHNEIASASSDDDEITINKSGIYQIRAYVMWEAEEDFSESRLDFRLNNDGTVIHWDRNTTPSTAELFPFTQTFGPVVSTLTAGETLDMRVEQQSGVDQELRTGDGNARLSAQFFVSRLG